MKKICLLIVFCFLLISCGITYGISHNMKYVKDQKYYWDGIPSYQVNTSERYCVFYTDRINNTIKEKNNYNLIISFLKNKNIKIKEEFLFKSNAKTTKDDTLEVIKKREMENNFKNCNYLVEFILDKGVENPESIFLDIIIKDLKSNKKSIGFYSMREKESIFNKKTQEQKIEKMLTEWWKTQNKPQPKARPLETYCVGNCDNNK